MDNITAREAYRRSNARELTSTMLGDEAEAFDSDLIVDALLEADPYESEFNDIDTQGFWQIARRYCKDILLGDTVRIGVGKVRWVVQTSYSHSWDLESARGARRTIRRNSGQAMTLTLLRRHGRPDLTD